MFAPATYAPSTDVKVDGSAQGPKSPVSAAIPWKAPNKAPNLTPRRHAGWQVSLVSQGTPRPALTPSRREAVLEQVYRDHYRYLMCLLLSRVDGDKHLAEDIVQETMVRAWRNAERLDTCPEATQAWLTTVAKNVLVDTHRRRQARPKEVPCDATLTWNMPHSHDGYAQVVAATTVQRTLPKLKSEQQEVLRLAYLMDLSMEEIANRLGIPVGTVKSRLFYALRSMRAILDRADARAERAG